MNKQAFIKLATVRLAIDYVLRNRGINKFAAPSILEGFNTGMDIQDNGTSPKLGFVDTWNRTNEQIKKHPKDASNYFYLPSVYSGMLYRMIGNNLKSLNPFKP